jgi:response regulator RpfG family c-di-GMP phosphodiesterase
MIDTGRNENPQSAGRVLVVDDDPATVKLIERVLSSSGYEVVTAFSGNEAMENVQAVTPQAIILDIMMPGMNGFEVCRRLRADSRFEGVPIIMLTALDDMENRVAGIEMGADEYMTKPFHVKELLARVRSVMRVLSLRKALEESLVKVRHFNAFVENVTMGLDGDHVIYADIERLIISQFLAGGIPATRSASIVLAGRPSLARKGFIDCRLYYMDGGRLQSPAGEIGIPNIIWGLPQEVSIGLRFGRLHGQEAESIERALPPAVFATIGPVKNAAVFAEGSLYLAAFNYERSVTQFDAELLRGISLYLSINNRLSSFAVESDEAFKYAVGALARAAEALDTDTGDHVVRVNSYARILALELGLPGRFVSEIGFQAQLHDVGKIHIDPLLLRKPGKLDPAEWEEMKRHTIYGAKIIGNAPRLEMANRIALTHHERWDGSGYPEGLSGEGIPMEGRITAVADVYDAIRNKRAYKPAESHETAVKAILRGDSKSTGACFDPAVSEAFRRLEKKFEELYEAMK